MKTTTDITLLLAQLGECELTQDTKSRLTRVVEASRAELEKVRDDLWQSGEQQSATNVDRLISAFHPACQPEAAALGL
jgi:hypothetical protein